jgi:hypothetical protein
MGSRNTYVAAAPTLKKTATPESSSMERFSGMLLIMSEEHQLDTHYIPMYGV